MGIFFSLFQCPRRLRSARTVCGGTATAFSRGGKPSSSFCGRNGRRYCSSPVATCTTRTKQFSRKEQEYRLIKELFAFDGHRIAVCFQYEFRDAFTGLPAHAGPRKVLRFSICTPVGPRDLVSCVWQRELGLCSKRPHEPTAGAMAVKPHETCCKIFSQKTLTGFHQ